MAKVRLAALVAVSTVAVSITAQDGQAQNRERNQTVLSRLRSATPRKLNRDIRLPGREKSGRSTVLIEFDGRPAALAYRDALGRGRSAATADSRKAVTANRGAQTAARGGIEAAGGRVLYSTQRVLNATVAVVDSNRIAEIRRLPGVKSVKPAPIHRLDNSTSSPFIGSNAAWDASGALGTLGLTGEGISIAVIDTGIDYLHENFDGDESQYSTQDPNVINSDGVGFPTSKVVFGFDLAGDAYDAGAEDGSEVPVPDDDPTDCNGHGSHVAGSAAGFGVLGGSTYTGGYDNLDAGTLAGFEIGPGVAPEASLWALKVFGCNGSTALTLQAIEIAVDPNGDGDVSDHVDVINMSLGSAYGAGEDASAAAASNAAAAGVVVVASAGNEGDAHFITGSPGAGTNVISVAASADGGVQSGAVVAQGTLVVAAFPAEFSPAIVATGAMRRPAVAIGCDAGDYAGFPAGSLAVVDRGECSFQHKAAIAQDAGAAGVIIANVTTCSPFVGALDPAEPAITIPTVMVSCVAGDSLLGRIGMVATIDPTQSLAVSDLIADFSSRGPRRLDLSGRILPKPDVSAPGVDITSTLTGYNTGPGTDPLTISGTSMAAPHVAGAMALLRQRHPDWTVAELKAAIMNTANQDLKAFSLRGPRVGASRAGTGRVNVLQAVQTPVIAYAADDPGGVGVGFVADVVGDSTSTQTREVLVHNRGTATAAYKVSVKSAANVSGIKVAAKPSNVSVPAGGTRRITLTATFNPKQMLHDLDPAMLDMQSAVARHWTTEYSANLTLTSTSNTRPGLRVPVLASARPASHLFAANQPALSIAGTGSLTLGGPHVKNTTSQLTPSGFSKSAESLVGGYELLWQSPNEDPELNQTIDAADIRYVGVASDIADGSVNSYAALSTWKEWSTPAELLAGVTLDVDQDGLPDWIYITAPIDETDVYQILLIDINDFSGAGSGASFEWDVINGIDADTDTRVLKSDVMTIPFQTHPAFWGSLTTSGADSSHAFDFSVFAFHFDDDVNFDESPILTFDPEQPGLAFEAPGRLPEAFGGVTPFSRSVSGGTLPFRINVSGPGDAAKALLVHNFNAAGRRAEIVSIDTEVASDQLLTNGDLEGGGSPVPTGWVGTGLKPGDSLVSNNPAQGTFAFQFSGKATSARTLSQTVPFSPGEGDAGDVLRFDAQVSAGGMQTGDSAKLTLEITYTDGKKQVVVTPLNDQMEYGVPRSAGLVIAAKPYKQVKVTVSATLKNDASSLFVDEFSLSRPQY